MAHESLLTLDSVSKSFGEKTALSDFTLSVSKGERILITGPNGAGKSTLLKICAGLLRPDAGERELSEEAAISFLSEQFGLYRNLTVEENLKFFAPEIEEEALEEWGVVEALSRPFETLSSGEKTRTALAIHFARKPALFLIDEALSMLDDEGLSLFERRAENTTAYVVASHERERLRGFTTKERKLT